MRATAASSCNSLQHRLWPTYCGCRDHHVVYKGTWTSTSHRHASRRIADRHVRVIACLFQILHLLAGEVWTLAVSSFDRYCTVQRLSPCYPLFLRIPYNLRHPKPTTPKRKPILTSGCCLAESFFGLSSYPEGPST